MKRLFLMKTKRMLFAVTALTILMAAMPVAASAAGNTVTLTAKQAYSTNSPYSEATFTYRLKPLDKGNPMPLGSDEDGYTFRITGSGSVEIGPISYDRQGVYRYELYQVAGAEKQGLAYDRRGYTVEVHVDELLNAYVIVLDTTGAKTETIAFANRYFPGGGPPDPPDPQNPPDPTKPPDPARPPGPIWPSDGPNPDEAAYYPDDGGTGHEDEIHFYPDDDEDLDFWGIPGLGLQPATDSPKTGDDMDAALYAVLFGAGALIAIGAAMILIFGRKRKRKN